MPKKTHFWNFWFAKKKTKKNSNPENIKGKLIVFTPFLVSLAPQARKFSFLDFLIDFCFILRAIWEDFLDYIFCHTQNLSKVGFAPKKSGFLKKNVRFFLLLRICRLKNTGAVPFQPLWPSTKLLTSLGKHVKSVRPT